MINKSQLMNCIIVWADELLAMVDKVDQTRLFKSKRIEYETMVKLYHWDKEQYEQDMKGDANEK